MFRKVAITDIHGILCIMDILRGEKLLLERKEVWDLKWSEVSSLLLHTLFFIALMSKAIYFGL